MPSFGFIPLMVSEKKIFKHFYENWSFLPYRQQIKFTDLDKSHMKRNGLLNKHFCIFFSPNIPNGTEKTVNFHFSHLFVPPTRRYYIVIWKKIALKASEEMSS